MAKVWAVLEGDRLRIDGHGFATTSEPCEVPDEVAAELLAEAALAQAAGRPVRIAFEAPTVAAVTEPQTETEQAPPAPARSKRGRATPQEE